MTIEECMEMGARAERERLREAVKETELAFCPDGLHQHAHTYCNGRDIHALLAEPAEAIGRALEGSG